MRKLFLMISICLACTVVYAQIQVKQIGKVHYTIIPSNEPLSLRNDSIAKALNDYIQQNANKKFPDVLLNIFDSNPNSELTNSQEILVYYQKYRSEFFSQYDNYYFYDKPYIGITLSLSKDHYQKGMKAIKYA